MPVNFGNPFGKPGKGSVEKKVIHVPDDPVEAVELDTTDNPRRERLRDDEAPDARIKALRVEIVDIDAIQVNPRNAKKHPPKQIDKLQQSYEQFGFIQPIVVDEKDVTIAGHGRWLAAKRAGFRELPVIRLSHLTPAKKRALAISDNKLAELGQWDEAVLKEELSYLFDPELELEFDADVTGFETVEVDQIVGDGAKPERADPADDFEPVDPRAPAVTRHGDLLICGEHQLLCADATGVEGYFTLMERNKAEIVFTDPPYNVPNSGHVTKREGVAEFAMAAGEMSSDQFTAFLSATIGNIRNCMQDGAVGFFCMDWRHLPELSAAADPLFGPKKNLIVWVKRNAGMGSFYRSQHELICVYAAPGKPINNFGLGGKGRHRTNVWEYAGFNGFVRDRDEILAMHPTVKPVAMVMDALKDCSHRGGIVLDPFAGSGTTMIAAERTRRRARLMEIDPHYCDTIVKRWQKYTGKTARLAETDETFEEVKARRGAGR